MPTWSASPICGRCTPSRRNRTEAGLIPRKTATEGREGDLPAFLLCGAGPAGSTDSAPECSRHRGCTGAGAWAQIRSATISAFTTTASRGELQMAIKAGDRVPAGKLKTMTKDGPKDVTTDELFKGKKVVLFSVPGAFTPTCDAKHLPGFVQLDRKSTRLN